MNNKKPSKYGSDLSKSRNKSKLEAHNNKDGSNNFSARRLPGNKEMKSDKTPDQTHKSTISKTSNASKKTKEGVKSRSDCSKTNLEKRIHDLMTLTKTKDVEISCLRTKLDQMMQLINQQDFSKSLKSQYAVGSGFGDSNSMEIQAELLSLKKENAKLEEKLNNLTLFQRNNTKSSTQTSNTNESRTFSGVENLNIISDTGVADKLPQNCIVEGSIAKSSEGNSDGKSPDECGSETSSVTVACLTERIHQMEESHISTHEELEATVQELTDLQQSVPELTIENNRLQQDRNYLKLKVEMLEKQLDEATTESNHLRNLVSDRPDDSELQQQYLELLGDRQDLVECQDDLNNQLRSLTKDRHESEELINALQERMCYLERELNRSNTEKSFFEKKLRSAKDTAGQEHVKALQQLEEELEQERRKKENKSLTSANLDQLHFENQNLKENNKVLEDEVNELHEQVERMDSRISELEEEQEAAADKSKRDLSELSELIDKLQDELQKKQASLDEAKETLFVMEDSVEQHLAVKKLDKHVIQKLQTQLSSEEESKLGLQKEIDRLKKEQRQQSEEWKQFQNDLQMAVIIANDMKAETQSEVTRLREENQLMQKQLAHQRFENEKYKTTASSGNTILDSPSLRHNSTSDVRSLCENLSRHANDSSPGVQGLIKSFNRQVSSPLQPLPVLMCDGNLHSKSRSPNTATVSPLPRQPSSPDLHGSGDAPNRTATNLEFSSYLRRTASSIAGKKLTEATSDRLASSSAQNMSTVDPLACLARQYGGSKRNALLKWCQDKTSLYPGIDITNFSSSWSDGLALCALLHSYLPAHIPYDTLRHNYDSASDDTSRGQLQAKNFRLAFAAAESVGIEPTLSIDMMTKERPDWQSVMSYVTRIYKYFET